VTCSQSLYGGYPHSPYCFSDGSYCSSGNESSVTIANTGYGSPTEPVFNVDLGYQSSVGSPAYYVEF